MERGTNPLFINREFSWLEFNRRVLNLSQKKGVPLGEQLNFAAIYGSNLDEFFMVRVGSLYDQTLLKNETRENKTNMTAKQQLAGIMPRVAELQKNCDKNVAKLFEKLKSQGLHKVDFSNLGNKQAVFWKKYFLREFFPVLSPLIIDKRHPFPFLRDRETYVAALVREKKSATPILGLVPVSSQYERLLFVNQEDRTDFALVEELVLHFADEMFGKAAVEAKCLFRVTRNADLTVEEGMFDHDIDYREVMSELLKKRRKLAAVRLQFVGPPPEWVCSTLLDKLPLSADQVFIQSAPMDLSFLHRLRARLEKLGKPELFYPVARPIQLPAEFRLYKMVQKQDLLLSYPYQSFRSYVQFLNDAARDPAVISIKITLYRLAAESQVIDALIAAAEHGKDVVAILELRARFDEQNNIDWSRRLEQAGCTIIYGFSDYKVHSKLTLITRKKGAHFEYVSQVGTGNYNEKTSELYTDLSYFTASQEIGEEVGAVFNNLSVERLTSNVKHLIVAPLCFKTVLLGEIKKEMEAQRAGRQGRIRIKCNSISDKDIIGALSKASEAGVQIDMVVRGICCLQAGLKGISENIRVRSIVGRYLEHSRIYAFGEEKNLRCYIASGDFLTRNTERRVEVGVRIDDARIQNMLLDILNMQLADNVNAREMQPDGSYAWVKGRKDEPETDSQMGMYPYYQRHNEELRRMAAEGAKGNKPARGQKEPTVGERIAQNNRMFRRLRHTRLEQ